MIVLRSALLLLCMSVSAAAAGLTARVLLPDGSAAAHAQVAVVGRPGSMLTDADGRVAIVPDPQLPVTLIITTEHGEMYPPVTIKSTVQGETIIALEPRFRESLTVVSGIAPTLEASPASATAIVSAEAIEQDQPERLADAVASIPGVSGTGMGAASVPSIRGLSRGRTVILIDESRVSTERRAGASATFLDPFTFSSVEVARGPGSVAYGSDAFGGVILIRPRDPALGESSVRFDVAAAAGATPEQRGGIELTWSRGERAVLLAVHGRDAGEASAGGGEPILDSSYHDMGAEIRFLQSSRGGVIRAGYSRADGRDIGKPEWTSATTSTIYPIETSDRLSFSWDSAGSGSWSGIELDAFAGRYRLVLDRNRLTTGLLERSDVSANDASLRITATRPAGAARLQLGGELVTRFSLRAIGERLQFDPSGALASRERETSVDEAQRRDGAVFVLLERPVGSRLLLAAGGRFDSIRAENQGGFFGDRSRSSSALAGHIAATANVARGVTATLQAARGFRDPTLSDRYFRGVSGRGFVIGSPDLRAERSLQFDGALRWQAGRRSLALYGYDYRIRDLVERYRSGSDYRFRNRGESYVRGIELEGEYALSKHLGAQIGAAAARGGVVPSSEPVDDIASPGGHLAVRYAAERSFASVTFNAFARHGRPGPSEHALPGYATVDLAGGFRFTDQLELRVRVGNVADRRYVGAADEVAPWAAGRSISIALSGRIATQQ